VNLNDIVPDGCVLMDLKSTQKENVFREMLLTLVRAGKIDGEGSVRALGKILEREAFGSTGIGSGIAVPHGAHECELVCVVGRSESGVAYEALDGEPVYLFILLLSGMSQSGSHLEALAAISRLVRDNILLRRLREAESEQELRDLLGGGGALAS